MAKLYAKPSVTVLGFMRPTLLVGSVAYPQNHTCNSECGIWHICNDREGYRGHYCKDKRI